MRDKKQSKKKGFQLQDNIEDGLPEAVIEFFDLLREKIEKKESLVDILQYFKGFLAHYSYEADRSLSDPEWIYMAVIGLMLLKNSNIESTTIIQANIVEEAAKRKFRKKDVKFHLKDLVDKSIIELYYPNKRGSKNV